MTVPVQPGYGPVNPNPQPGFGAAPPAQSPFVQQGGGQGGGQSGVPQQPQPANWGIPQQPAQPQPVQHQPQQTGYSGYPSQQVPATPQIGQQGTYGQLPPQQPAPQGWNPDALIPRGAGFPPELEGRPFRDMQRYYQVMRADFLQRQQQMQTAGMQAPTLQMPASVSRQLPAGQQPQYMSQQGPDQAAGPQYRGQPQQPQSQPQQQFDPRQLLSNPQQVIGQIVQEQIQPYLQPVMQMGIQHARQQMYQRYPDFAQYEGAVSTALSQVDPQLQANPQTWEMVYFHERGRRSLLGTAAPQQPNGPQAFGNGGYSQPPAPTQYFSEAPTPPQPMPGAPRPQLSYDPAVMAAKFGMPGGAQQFMDWAQGRVPEQGGSNGRGY